MMNTVGGIEEFFIKRSVYAEQSEFRLLWGSVQPI
jgi:hypothetical protein